MNMDRYMHLIDLDRFIHPPELDTLYQLLEEVGDGSPSESEMATILAALNSNLPGTISLIGHYKVFNDARVSTAINEIIAKDLGAFIQLIDIPGLEAKDTYLVMLLPHLKTWPLCTISIRDKPMYKDSRVAVKVDEIIAKDEMLNGFLQNIQSAEPVQIDDPSEPPMPEGGWGPAPPVH
jgi:hypothetical protein